MPFPSRTPYEVLDISPYANLQEIMQGYQRAMKQRRYPAGQITQAFNDLRNARKRAEHDLLVHTGLGNTEGVHDILGALPAVEFVSDDVTPIPIPLALTGLGSESAENEYAPLPPAPLSFAITNAYDKLDLVAPPIQFPD